MVPGPYGPVAVRREDPALVESAWERGLRQAKEVLLLDNSNNNYYYFIIKIFISSKWIFFKDDEKVNQKERN